MNAPLSPLFTTSRGILLCALAAFSLAGGARGATYTWNTNADGSWATAGLWTPAGGPPNAASDVANLTFNITAARAITLDGAQTIGILNVGDNDRSYTLNDGTGGSLTFNNGGSAAQLNQVSTSVGNTVNATLMTVGNLSITNNSSGNSGLTLTGGLTSTALSGTQTVTFSGSSTGTTLYSGNIANGASGTIAVTIASGSIRLSGVNTFSGGTTLDGGILSLANNGTLPVANSSAALGSGTLTINGGTLTAPGNSTINLINENDQVWNGNFQYTVPSNSLINFGATGDVSLGTAAGTSRTIDFAPIAGTLRIGGVVSNGMTANTIIKNGGGTLNLNNTGNTFSNLEINEGTVSTTVAPAGSSSGDYAAPTSLGTPFGTGTITLRGGTLSTTVNAGNSGGGYSQLGNNIVLAANSTITPILGGGGNRNVIFSGLISGSAKLTINQGVTNGNPHITSVFLSHANNTYTGGTDLNTTGSTTGGKGTQVVIDAENALGGGTGGTGGVVTFVNNSNVANQQESHLVLKADQSIAGLHSSTANSNGLGSTFVTGSSATARTLTINNTAGGTGDNSVYSGAIGGTPNAITVNSGITGTAAAGNNINIVKTGTGTQTLSGTNTYTGTTTVSGGTFIVSGTLVGATGNVSVTGGTFNYTNNGTALSRNVTINGGTFKYNSSQAYAGSLTFTSGTIGGSGNLSGVSLDIGAGRTLSPGNSPGTVPTGAETWSSGGSYLWEINDFTGTAGADPGWDLAQIGGALSITASAGSEFSILLTSLTLGNTSGAADNFVDSNNYQFLIADSNQTITTFLANKFNLNTSGILNSFTGTWGITRGDAPGIIGGDDSQLYLTYTAVPEPSAPALIYFSLGTLWLLQRRTGRSKLQPTTTI